MAAAHPANCHCRMCKQKFGEVDKEYRCVVFSPQGRFTSDSHVSKTTSVHQHHCIIICIKPEDKDCPPGAEFTVDNVKGGNICGTCTYVHRGSFEKYTVNAFIEQLEKCVPLEDKSLSRSLFTRLVRYIIFGVFLIHVAACA